MDVFRLRHVVAAAAGPAATPFTFTRMAIAVRVSATGSRSRDWPQGRTTVTARTKGVAASRQEIVILAALAVWHWAENDGADMLGSLKATGGVSIGGPFTLTDHEDNSVTEEDFLGRHTLVYFGYTFCPNVCPMELQSITEALEQLGRKTDGAVPLFITVDPQRDTVEVMADYAGHFIRAFGPSRERRRRYARRRALTESISRRTPARGTATTISWITRR